MKKLFLFLCSIIIGTYTINAQTIKGRVVDENGEPMPAATVLIKELNKGLSTDNEGKFKFNHLPKSDLTLKVSFVGYNDEIQKIDLTEETEKHVHIKMTPNTNLNEVEVFGERYKQPEKLDAITRMPLRPSEQIQSISIISDKIISEQGVLSITDAAKNIPGVTLFSSYGGVRESMSTRGYRGVPILKNGVRVDSDHRTASLASDMQGVESIQVIKGSAAITQGIGDDVGAPGGVINVVTKTPKFVNGGEVSMRAGSWNQIRPTFDIQSILDKNRTVAFRMNGAYEKADSYQKHVNKNRVYINPSLEWRPDNKTNIIIEGDYMNDNTTPNRGTVNLANDDVNALYKMPHNKFLGFKTDNVLNKSMTYAARINRQITEKLSVRAAYFNSDNSVDNTGIGALSKVGNDYNIRNRTLTRSLRKDKNTVFQLDLIGKDIYSGSIRHTFQVGFDYKSNNLETTSFNLYTKSSKGADSLVTVIDKIDIFKEISNTLPTGPNDKFAKGLFFRADTPVKSSSSGYGIMLQEVMTINKYAKAILGIRYSYAISQTETSSAKVTGEAWNPMAGIMLTPIKNVNFFGSYTTNTGLRSASMQKPDGSTIGASTSKQWETGIKSDWLDNRLRFNFTYFTITNRNLAYNILDNNGVSTPFYDKAGDLLRNGIETELSGRITNNLQVMLGYAYLNAHYENSPAYINGSRPMNAPTHTANGWAHYFVDKGALKGMGFGMGTYYVGKRPINEYTQKTFGHNTKLGIKPFDMPGYTTVNLQLSYKYKNFTTRIFMNNIFDEIGYNSYFRGGYINQTDPRNFAGNISYKF